MFSISTDGKVIKMKERNDNKQSSLKGWQKLDVLWQAQTCRGNSL